MLSRTIRERRFGRARRDCARRRLVIQPAGRADRRSTRRRRRGGWKLDPSYPFPGDDPGLGTPPPWIQHEDRQPGALRRSPGGVNTLTLSVSSRARAARGSRHLANCRRCGVAPGAARPDGQPGCRAWPERNRFSRGRGARQRYAVERRRRILQNPCTRPARVSMTGCPTGTLICSCRRPGRPMPIPYPDFTTGGPGPRPHPSRASKGGFSPSKGRFSAPSKAGSAPVERSVRPRRRAGDP